MFRTLSVLCAAVALFCSTCAEERLVCAELDEARVCRPESECAACACSEKSLVYGEDGFITLHGVFDHPYSALDDMAILLALGDGAVTESEWLDGPTWSTTVFLVPMDGWQYFAFYGSRVIALRDENGEFAEVRYVIFWGMWFTDDSPMMSERISAFAESIEIIQE